MQIFNDRGYMKAVKKSQKERDRSRDRRSQRRERREGGGGGGGDQVGAKKLHNVDSQILFFSCRIAGTIAGTAGIGGTRRTRGEK